MASPQRNYPPYEQLLAKKGEPAPEGYDAMGYQVPPNRLARGYAAVKEMLPDASTEEAMTIVGRVASCIERDDPYGALLDHSQGFKTDLGLDLIGRYRLLATLCCDG